MLSRLWSATAFLTTASALAQSPCSPFAARVFDPGPTPEAIETADFDADGDMDLVIADSCLPQVRVLWNDGVGGFDLATDLSTWDPARTVLARDLDDDGDDDIVATETNAETHVLVFTNQAGTFTLSQRLLVDANGFRSDLADFEGDGQPELILCARTNSSATEHGFYTLPNLGGSFGSPEWHSISGSTPMTDTEVLDFNGDGTLDVVGLVGNEMYVWSYFHGIGLILSNADAYPGVTRIVAGKIDGDAFADRVLLRYGPKDVVVLLTSVPGPITLASYASLPTEARIADLDGDGLLDLRIAAGEIHDYLRVPGGAFTSDGSRSTPADSTHFASADFDGDGAVDAAVVSPVVDSLALVFAKGPSYAPALRLSANTAVDQDFADIDHDGDLDVVRTSPSSARVYRNDGGTLSPVGEALPPARHARFVDLIAGGAPEVVLFSETSTLLRVCATAEGLDYAPLGPAFGTGVSPHSLAAGDLDQDGHLDLVFGNAAMAGPIGPIVIYRGRGDGTFDAPSSFYALNDPIALELADVDGDSDLDVVAATEGVLAAPIIVLRNADGVLGGPEPVASALSAGGQFTLGDVDRDGDVDVVAAASYDHELHVFANDGSGVFGLASTLPLARSALSMELAHVDGDGALDLVTLETSSPFQVPSQLVAYRRGDGTGGFELASQHATSALEERLVLADFTNDGDVDVLLLDATSPGYDGVWVLENAGACTTGDTLCAGDGSGTACPCGNSGASGRGCANSFDVNGAELSAAGAARVSSVSMTLSASGLPPATLVHFLQSEATENAGAGIAFGDGLLCLGGTIRRLAVRRASAGLARLGAAEAVPISLATLGQLPPLGGTRYYQARYRNVASFCTNDTFNTTNALRVVWGD